MLSQVLVAFTVEFDNEFERRMGEAGYPGARLSLVVWANVMRFVAGGAVSVRDLAAQALALEQQVKFQLGCLERWGFVALHPDAEGDRPSRAGKQRQSGHGLREGWGSGRGVGAGWMVRLTPKGLTAADIWPPLFGEIEQRWETRFGNDEINRLRQTLQCVAGRLEFELPHGLPGGYLGTPKYPLRVTRSASHVSFAPLLSQLLLTFRLEFDHESPVPLVHCANTLRVLSEEPTRMADIPRLTGGSPETSDIGWEIKPYVVVEPDPTASRGKVVRLSPRGLRAQHTYHRLVGEIEKRWEGEFGKEEISRLRESLQGLLDRRNGDRPLLSEGLVPPAGTVRAGDQAPALGRRDVGAAARQRMRDLQAQTEAFVRNPAEALPHYPAWDMNRGFGP
ncbi:MAG: hypothetical protein ACLQVL_04765 [Terriglobia bacterium]